MKPTFDSREITRRFRIEWSERTTVVRIYVEARYKKNGHLYWRKVWTSGQSRRGRDADIWDLLQIDRRMFGDALDLDAGDVILSELPAQLEKTQPC